jgi:hypothetical protein
MLTAGRVAIGFALFVALSCKPSESKMTADPIRECINTGDVTLSQFVGNPDILRHRKFEDFSRAILNEDERFEFSENAEWLSVPKPECQVCETIEYDDFRFLRWRKGEKDRVFRQFRIYINAGEVECVETNFGYLNPYQ